MNDLFRPLPMWQKKVIAWLTGLLAVAGVIPALAACLLIPIAVFTGASSEIGGLVAVWAVLAYTLAAGTLSFIGAIRALRGKASQVMRFPPIWAVVGLFSLALAAAAASQAMDWLHLLVFPPFFIVAAALPPLWAVVWFATGASPDEGAVTRRYAVAAFAGGATAGVLFAIVLEILLPAVVLTLVFDLANTALEAVEALVAALAGGEIAEAITGPGFIYAFIQLALIAPLAEELAKPLITLPVVGRVPRRTAFLVGALAGAGFAALENVLYAGFGLSFWAGILVVRAVGGAIHPLGAGLMALGWRAVLRGEPGAGRRWLGRFGLAAGLHALWNGGSLLVITLAGARFFGELPPEVDVLGLSAGGTTLAFLVVLGLGALWLGRTVAREDREVAESGLPEPPLRRALSDRALALWAMACLLALVPAGIAGLKLLLEVGP